MSDVKQLGTILLVFAHPDDESFMTGGLMAMAAQNGQTVACITATRGDAGQTADDKKWPKANLSEIRTKELNNALKSLGVKNHHWLGYKDGECNKVPMSEGVSHVLKYIGQYNPATIITFNTDGLTGHDDHKSVCRWATEAVKQSDRKINLYYAVETKANYDKYMKRLDEKFNIYFNIDKPNLFAEDECDLILKLPPEAVEAKIKSLKAQASQTGGMFKEFDDGFWRGAVGSETFIRASF